VKKMLVVIAALALLVPATLALASPVQQFSFQLTNIKPDGRFTLLFNARYIDSTGGVPPDIASNYLRLPAGAVLDRQFLNKSWYCNGPKLRDSLDRHPLLSGEPFANRVTDLTPFIKLLSGIKHKSKLVRSDLANAQLCKHAQIGAGTAKIDARESFPLLSSPIPAKFAIYFSKATAKGAVAGFTVVGAALANAGIVKRYPIVAGVHVALSANFFNEPTTIGAVDYGYKLVLPQSNANGIKVSIAELHVRNPGLSILKGVCLKTDKRGKCVRRQKKTAFWFTRPKCPPSGRISFLDVFTYAPPLPGASKLFTLACPKFS
jgi:hypothetical protein